MGWALLAEAFFYRQECTGEHAFQKNEALNEWRNTLKLQ